MQVSFGWDETEKLRKMTKEEYNTFTAQWPEIRFEEYGTYVSWPTLLYIELETLNKLTEAGFKVSVEKISGMQYNSTIATAVNTIPNITNVSVCNNALFEVTQVKVIEDSCTDVLQEYLNKGWRILAVCPSNDSRRPDYILGQR